MISKLKRLLRGEGGITGLETAIILIAFVVVAAVFAFTVLSAGVFSSEKGKEAVHAGLSEVRGSMELRGSVMARGLTATQTISHVVFTVANVAGGEAIDFTAPTESGSTGLAAAVSDHKVVIAYRDKTQDRDNLAWTMTEKGYDDGDDLLEEGELFEITVPITPSVTNLVTNTLFILEVKPEQGGILVIERTTPAHIDTWMDLH